MEILQRLPKGIRGTISKAFRGITPEGILGGILVDSQKDFLEEIHCNSYAKHMKTSGKYFWNNSCTNNKICWKPQTNPLKVLGNSLKEFNEIIFVDFLENTVVKKMEESFVELLVNSLEVFV